MSEVYQVIATGTREGPSLRDIAGALFRHIRLLKISFLLVFAGAMAYAIMFPSYEAHMKILVRRGRIDPAMTPTQTVSPLLQQDVISEEELNSQSELLHDDEVLRTVAVQNHLADGSWIQNGFGEDAEERVARAVRKLSSKLQVAPARKSQIITVSYRSSDPRLSAAVLRSLAEAYLTKQAEITRPNGQQAFFEEQMQQSRIALQAAQGELLDFLRVRNIASAGLERDLALQRLSEAQSADLELRAAIAESAERVRSVEGELREVPERRVALTRNADNPQLQEKLKTKLLELQLKRTELLSKFQPSYRVVTEVEEQIAQTKSAIQQEQARPLLDETTEEDPDHQWLNSERLKRLVEMQALLKREALARRQVVQYRNASQQYAEGVVEQADLERKVKAAEDKYLLYASKREEARIGDALDHSGILNVTVAEQPHVPALPVTPLWLTTCLSLAAAGVVSTGSVFAAEYVDPTIRTTDEAVRVLGTRVLASLPLHETAGGRS